MSSSDALLAIEGLSVSLPQWADRSHAVQDLSLSLARNEILCVVGESGSGKSITGRAIMRLLPSQHMRCDTGRILFQGEDLLLQSEARMRQIRGGSIGMIFQEPMTALNPLMTVGRQIDEILGAHVKLTRPERKERVLHSLREVHLPDVERLFQVYPHELSGGQRQRVVIAMALALKPAMLIADEPTTALDVTTQAQILKLIRELQAEHRSGVLFVTHDFGVVAEIADRVAVMQQGKLVEIGPKDEILNRPQHPYTRALIGAVPTLKPRKPRYAQTAPTILQVDNLEKVYGMKPGLFKKPRTIHAVRDASLILRQGETLGLVGESGSGKSTLARCIIRLIHTNRGSIRLGEVDLSPLSPKQMRPYRKRIQMVFQDPFGSLNARLKVGEIIAQGMIVHGASATEAKRRTVELLGLVGLDARAVDRFPHEFSGGQRQRIGIARALALNPDVLIADEPVSALDVSVQAQVLQLLETIREQFKLAMLFITHDLRVAAQICDTVAVMRRGEIVEYGPTNVVFERPQHEYTQQLLDAMPGKDWDTCLQTA